MSEVFLGDGLYVSFDGWQYQLRAPRLGGDHVVFLNPYVLRAFDEFRGEFERKAAEARTPPAQVD